MVKPNRKNIEVWLYLVLTLAFLWGSETRTQGAAPLRLIQTIPLPGVSGRIDHMAIDLKGGRLFLAAVGNNSLEVLDLPTGRHLKRISGLKEPQGVVYVSGLNRLFVTNGGDGSCHIYEGDSFRLIGKVKFSEDADNIRYDPGTRQIYVGYGRGALGAIEASNGKRIGDVGLAGHPESFVLEERGSRIFINIPSADQVAVVDRSRLALVTTWPVVGARSNFPMALDETSHRLFIGCRQPPIILVFDSESHHEVTRLEIAGDVDDIFYDPALKRIYASGGGGLLNIIQQNAADQYILLAKISTAKGARTSLFVPEQRRLYLAIPDHGKQPARVHIYALDP